MALSNETSVSLNNLNEYDAGRFRNTVKIGTNATSTVPNTTVSSIAIGKNASSNASVVVGPDSTALAPYGVAVGYNCNTNFNGVAIGRGISDDTYNSISMGMNIDLKTTANTRNNDGMSVAVGRNILMNSVLAAGGDIHTKSVAIGNDILLNTPRASAIGTNVTVSNSADGVYVGSSITSNRPGIVIGYNIKSASSNTIAIGRDITTLSATTADIAAIMIGTGANGGAANTVAIGTYANAAKINNIAIGKSASAVADGSIAIGSASYAAATSIAIGQVANTSNGASSVAIGYNAKSINSPNSVVIGCDAVNSLNKGNGVTIGTGAASGLNAVAIGRSSSATGNFTVAVGRGANARTGQGSIAIGYLANGNLVIGNNAHGNGISIGHDASTAPITSSISIGHSSVAGNGATAIGNQANGNADSTIAIGNQAKAPTAWSLAIGTCAVSSNVAGQDRTMAIGRNAKSYAISSMAIGHASIAGGSATATTGYTDAITIGYASKVYSSNSIVIGSNATILNTSANNSLVIGTGVTVNAANSIAIGYGINTTQANLIVLGKYNTQVSGDIFEIGCGENNNAAGRKNAFRVTSNGDVIASGNIQDGNGIALNTAYVVGTEQLIGKYLTKDLYSNLVSLTSPADDSTAASALFKTGITVAEISGTIDGAPVNYYDGTNYVACYYDSVSGNMNLKTNFKNSKTAYIMVKYTYNA